MEKCAGKIEIRKTGITALDTDAIVNAANEGLQAGTGVCGAIFEEAGYRQLQKACDAIGHCDTGSAVITPGFQLKAGYIIHAVGPRWKDGKHGEPELLYGAYYRSLELAAENGCRSIGFPLISSGIFGYPVAKAWEAALSACRDFLELQKDDAPKIVFAIPRDDILEEGRKALSNVCAGQGKSGGNKLKIAGRKVDAVFFHRPEEPYGFLSNWFPSDFDLDGMRFSSVEQYIMYKKCMLFNDEISAEKVMATDDVALQQSIGRNASYIHNVWKGARQMVVFRGLMAKFSQRDDLKQRLLDTGDAYLVECAGSDPVWACGVRLNDDDRLDAEKWKGENILGFALMEVRERLRNGEK